MIKAAFQTTAILVGFIGLCVGVVWSALHFPFVTLITILALLFMVFWALIFVTLMLRRPKQSD